ncbi:MAG: O-antigen ligase family protein [Patescibacteria group bacterium]
MGLLKVLFLVNFPAFVFGEVVRISLFNIEVRLLDITSAILFIFWGAYCIKNNKISKIILLPFLLFIIFAFASLVLNLTKLNLDQFATSLLYLLRWTAYVGILPVVLGFDKNFKYLIKRMLLFTGIMVVLLGYLQYFFYYDLSNLYYLGWDEHLYRMFSVFLDPNFAGAFFVLFFLFLLNLIFENLKSKDKLIIYSLLSALTLITILLTYSRSSFVMLVFGVFLFLVIKKRVKYIVVIILALAALTLVLPKAYKTEGTNFFRTASSEARLGSYSQGISIFKESPIYGVGFNSYRFAKSRNADIAAKPNLNSHADSSNDNSFLFVLATTGLIGFSIFVFMWYKILQKYKKSSLVIASICALFIDSFFINSLFYVPIMFWLWTLIGTTESK